MSTAVLGPKIGQRLCEALGLPPRTKTIDIHIPADNLVTVTCEHYPDAESLETVVKVLALYELAPPPSEDVGHEMILPEPAPERRSS